MPDPQIIVGVAKTESGYTLFDQLGREHFVTDPQGIGLLIAEMCGDTDLPKAELVSPLGEKFKAAAVKISTRMVPPQYAEAVEPIVEVLGRGAGGIIDWWKRPKAPVVMPGAPDPQQTAASPSPSFKRRGPRPSGVPRKRLSTG